MVQETGEEGEEDSIKEIPKSRFTTLSGNLSLNFRDKTRKLSETRPKASADPE